MNVDGVFLYSTVLIYMTKVLILSVLHFVDISTSVTYYLLVMLKGLTNIFVRTVGRKITTVVLNKDETNIEDNSETEAELVLCW